MVVLAAGLALTGCSMPGSEKDPGQARGAELRDDSHADVSDRKRCTFPSSYPTYLPWLRMQDKVPSPFKDQFGGDAGLFWSAPRSSRWAYVGFRTESNLPGGKGKPTGLEHGGVAGRYHLGAIGFTIQWVHAAEGPCNLQALTLVMKKNDGSVSVEEGKREVLRIARSLRARGTDRLRDSVVVVLAVTPS